MLRIGEAWLCLKAVWELCRYDSVNCALGFKGNYEGLKRLNAVHGMRRNPVPPDRVMTAVERACAIYWKPVLCLQRSIVEARLLRRFGWSAEVVIGYRPAPFAGHAWVEVDGTAAGRSRPYQEQLFVLERIGTR